ncbi:uncharacterized protein LOC143196357 [Rhynchophorus ferrugineus]|uniref:uncharacterized protein LOC143196357 n=1 Tax=Rhynchophorus ferrugineus TaxID=354439 RepID=UPI003FCDAAEA
MYAKLFKILVIIITGYKPANIILALYFDKFEVGRTRKERDNGGLLLPVNSVNERVATVLNITVGTVNNIAYQMKNNTLDSPKKTRLHTKWVTNLDYLDIGSIRDQIYEMYKNNILLVEKDIPSKTVWICGRKHCQP